jgi:hypothetical protein
MWVLNLTRIEPLRFQCGRVPLTGGVWQVKPAEGIPCAILFAEAYSERDLVLELIRFKPIQYNMTTFKSSRLKQGVGAAEGHEHRRLLV